MVFKKLAWQFNYGKEGEIRINSSKINVNIFGVDLPCFNWFVGKILLTCYINQPIAWMICTYFNLI